MTDQALVRSDESVASRFSRLMNATTSPVGALTDPPLVATATAVLLVAFLAVLQLAPGPIATLLGALAALDAIGPGDPLRARADELRSEIQQKLLETARTTEPPAPRQP